MNLKVLVVFGGVSVEHEVSILSAIQVMSAMPLSYDVLPLYIAKDGTMYYDECLCNLETFQQIDTCIPKLMQVDIQKDKERYFLKQKKGLRKKEIVFDIVFPVLHGTNGEDGSFQGYLKTLGIPFVGCDVLGAAIGQDKEVMKMILQDRGLPLVPWFCWHKEETDIQLLLEKANRLGYPMIIKPANLGSSIGIGVAHHSEELQVCIQEAFRYDHKVLIEKLITPLREINCAVLGSHSNCKTSVLEEVMKQDDILSFHDKYEQGSKNQGMASATRQIPAQIPNDVKDEIQQYAKESFKALQAEGVCRIDFLVQKDTLDIYVNEVNTIPGSLAFYLWEQSGITFSELLEELLQLAKIRYRKRQQLTFTFETNLLTNYALDGKLGKKNKE